MVYFSAWSSTIENSLVQRITIANMYLVCYMLSALHEYFISSLLY